MSRKGKKKSFFFSRSVISLSLLSISLVIIGMTMSNQSRNSTVNEVSTADTAIDIAFTPENINLTLGSEQLVQVSLNTKYPILGSLIELSYDVAKLSISDVVTGNFFPNQISAPKVGAGKVAFGYGLPYDSTDGKAGSGVIASFKVKALTVGESEIDFTNNTDIIPSNQVSGEISIVTSTLKVSVVEKEKVLEPSSTPTPSQSPVPTPTPTPTPKPTKKPVIATPKPKPSVLVLPSPTPSPRVYEPLTGTPFDKTVEKYDARGVNVAVQDVKITPLPTLKPTIFTTIGNYFRKVIGI